MAAENAARNFVQKAITDTNETWEKSRKTAEENRKLLEHSYVTASKSAVDFNLKLIDMAQQNVNAAFDFARQLTRVTSPSEFFELSAAHAQKQFQAFTEQTQQLTTLAQKVTTEAAQPFQTGVAKTHNKST